MDEHLDMLMVCHHLSPRIPEDLAFAESRIRAETIAAEDVLHDLGAISMMSSDSQAMGRIGEVIIRTWQAADKMKRQRGPLPGEVPGDDNRRVKRYVAKYTINPAIAHGLADHVGSVEAGKLADLVMWKPAFFGVKPELVIKGGAIAWAAMGDPNASIPTPQPVLYRPMFGAFGARDRRHRAHVRVGGRAGRRRAPAPRALPARGGRPGLPDDRQARHDPQRRAPAPRGRSRDVRSARRWRAVDLRARSRPAHGPALLPLLGRTMGPSLTDQTPVITAIPTQVTDVELAGLERDPLVLTAEERRWARRRVTTQAGRELALALPTGTLLRPGEVLFVGPAWYVTVEAAVEPVIAVAPRSREEALRVAFEVGNRHFTLAIDGDRLLVPDDPAMEQLLERLGVAVAARPGAIRARRRRTSP